MKVSDYIEKGLKNLVKELPEGYEEVGRAKSACHTVYVFVKKRGEKLEDVKIKRRYFPFVVYRHYRES